MAIRLVVTQQAPSAADATTHPSAALSSGVRRQRILIDCGFCQGGRELSEENARPFGFEPPSIDYAAYFNSHRMMRRYATAGLLRRRTA